MTTQAVGRVAAHMSPTCRFRRSLLALSFAATLSGVPVQAGPALSWKLGLDFPVRWFKPSPAGVLLVGTEREILGVAADSGTVLWRLGPIRNPNSNNVELLNGSAAALLNVGIQDSLGRPPLSLIDLQDGHTLWACQQQGVLRSIGSFLIPGTNNLFLHATISPDGDRKTAMLVEMAGGTPIWTNESLGNELDSVLPFWYAAFLIRAHQVPLMDTDSTMIFHMRDGITEKFDLNTGTPVWTAHDKRAVPYTSTSDMNHKINVATDIMVHRAAFNEELKVDEDQEIEFTLAPMLESASGDRFYAPCQSSVAAYSLSNGERLWKDPPELNGAVAQMEETPAGLLVRTVEPSGSHLFQRILLLDVKTGKVLGRWPGKRGLLIKSASSSYWTDASNFLVEEDRVVVAAEGKLRTADLGLDQEQTLAKIKFDGRDDARTLQDVPGGYAVIGESNLGIYTKADGQYARKYYRHPPDDSGLWLALLALSAVSNGWVSPKLGLAALDVDLSASDVREGYTYFLANKTAEGQRGSGIVRVRRETGDIAGEVHFGRKTPTYTIDSEGRLCFLSDKLTVLCYQF